MGGTQCDTNIVDARNRPSVKSQKGKMGEGKRKIAGQVGTS